MTKNHEEICLNIYDKLVKLGKEVFGGSGSLSQECIDFENKWNINIGANCNQFLSENDFEKEFELIKSKLLRKTKKCVIFGNISSGKSSLINALLSKDILPTGFGSTSNCFVEIKASSTNENYLIMNKKRNNIEELKELNNIKSTNHLKNGSLITMYYNKKECELLKDDVVIIDAPGINSTFINENSMEEYFKDADVVVLVVNAQSGITTSDEQFFKDFRTRYTKLNVIIVFNFWDFVNPNGDDISLQEQCYTNAKNILCNMLQLTDAEAHSSIFFISASERKRISSNNITPNSGWNKRNESFERFLNYFQVKMSENLLTKYYKYLVNLKSIVTSGINQCQNCVSQMQNAKTNLEQNIRNELKSFERLHENISSEISEIFNKSFEKFLFKGLDILKQNGLSTKNEPKSMDIKKMTSDILFGKTVSTYQSYSELLREIIKENDNNLKYLEKHLKSVFNLGDDDISQFQQNIFNEIYFPFYYNLNNKLKSIDIEKFEENLEKINNRILYCKSCTVIIVGIGSLLTGAIVGKIVGNAIVARKMRSVKTVVSSARKAISAKKIKCIKTIATTGNSAATRLPVLTTVLGGMAGMVYGVSLTSAAMDYFQLHFRFAWKNQEMAIKELWALSQSKNYSAIIDEMILNFPKLITSIERKANNIQKKLDKIYEELKNF